MASLEKLNIIVLSRLWFPLTLVKRFLLIFLLISIIPISLVKYTFFIRILLVINFEKIKIWAELCSQFLLASCVFIFNLECLATLPIENLLENINFHSFFELSLTLIISRSWHVLNDRDFTSILLDWFIYLKSSSLTPITCDHIYFIFCV